VQRGPDEKPGSKKQAPTKPQGITTREPRQIQRKKTQLKFVTRRHAKHIGTRLNDDRPEEVEKNQVRASKKGSIGMKNHCYNLEQKGTEEFPQSRRKRFHKS